MMPFSRKASALFPPCDDHSYEVSCKVDDELAEVKERRARAKARGEPEAPPPKQSFAFHGDKTRIGCSSLGVLAGVDTYRTKFSLWAELVHGIEPVFDETRREAMEWGHRLEEPILRAWLDRTGRKLPWFFIHDESRNSEVREWQRYTPDYLLSPNVDLQIKCVSRERFAKDWNDGVPLRVVAQVTGEIDALRSESAYWASRQIDAHAIQEAQVAVLVGGSALKIFTVPFDPELAGLLQDEAERFWRDFVKPKRLPPADHTPECATALSRLHPRAALPLRAASEEETEIVRQLSHVKTEIDRIEKTKKHLENQLRSAIGDHRGLEVPGFRVTWSEVQGRTEWKRVAEEIAAKHGITLADFAEQFRGEPSRRLEVRAA